MPSDADTLAGPPSGDVRADGVDQSNDLVPWNARVLNAGKGPLLGEGVAVADPAGLDLDAYLAGAGSGTARSMISRGPFGRGTWTTRMVDIG